MAINNWWVSLRTALSMAAGSIPVHRSCMLSAREFLASKSNKNLIAARWLEQVGILRGYFWRWAVFQGSIAGSCSFSFLSPRSPLAFLNTVLQILMRAAVLFPFTTWHVLRLHGWLWHVDPFKKGLKTVLVLAWPRVSRCCRAYLTKGEIWAKFSSPRLLSGSFMGVMLRRCQRCVFLMRIVPPLLYHRSHT